MTEIEFSDPPPLSGSGTNRALFDEFADAIQARPGEWAKWPTTYTATGATHTAVRNALDSRGLDRSQYELAVRKTDDGRGQAWVRLLPEEDR